MYTVSSLRAKFPYLPCGLISATLDIAGNYMHKFFIHIREPQWQTIFFRLGIDVMKYFNLLVINIYRTIQKIIAENRMQLFNLGLVCHIQIIREIWFQRI